MKEIVGKSSSQLQNVISKLEQYNKNFESKVQEMVAEQKRVDGMWDGQANTEFNNNFNKEKKQFDAFHQAIADYIVKLKTIKTNYEQAETTNTRIAKTRR